MPVIKIDISTLPTTDNARVRFYSMRDEKWYNGVYVMSEQIFMIGFKETGDFCAAEHVLEWDYLL